MPKHHGVRSAGDVLPAPLGPHECYFLDLELGCWKGRAQLWGALCQPRDTWWE